MLISTSSALTFAFGALLGAGSYPVVALAQALASRLVSRGIWLHMVITMGFWALVMGIWVAVLNRAFEQALPFTERREHALYLLLGFMLGTFAGGFVARRVSSSSNEQRQ